MKICSKCEILKTLNEFSKRAKSKDGLNYICRSCQKIKMNKYKDLNKDNIITKEIALNIVDKEGNCKISFWIDEGYKRIKYGYKKYYLHRLVALAYGDKDIEGMDVHHIDEDKTNNHIDNLQILTKSDHTKLHNK